jgi:hypothetical protein
MIANISASLWSNSWYLLTFSRVDVSKDIPAAQKSMSNITDTISTPQQSRILIFLYVPRFHLDQVRNTRAVNRTGQPTGYRLVPGSNCLPFALPEAKFLRRAGFLKHNLWVTPYKSDEKFPGGEFPNQNPRLHEGLPTWVQKDRPLEETDIVLWYIPLTRC